MKNIEPWIIILSLSSVTHVHTQTQKYVFNQNKNLTRPRRVAHIIIIRITRNILHTLKFEICNRFGPRKFSSNVCRAHMHIVYTYYIELAYVCNPREKITVYTVEWRITRHYHDITIHNTIIRLCTRYTELCTCALVRCSSFKKKSRNDHFTDV